MLDAVVISVLPEAVCPVCLSTYAALFGSLGLGFLSDAAYLFPLFMAGIALAVVALGFKGRAYKNYGPFVLGLIAAAVIVLGKFYFSLDGAAAYFGTALLVAVSIWNFWS